MWQIKGQIKGQIWQTLRTLLCIGLLLLFFLPCFIFIQLNMLKMLSQLKFIFAQFCLKTLRYYIVYNQIYLLNNIVLLHYAVTEYFIHSLLLLVLMTSSNLICQWHLIDTCSVIPMDKLSVQCNLWSTLNNRPLQVHVPAVLVFLLPALSDSAINTALYVKWYLD